MDHNVVHVTCSLVIEQEGKLLLVQEAEPTIRGLWNQPAGHVEPGETFEQCALREAREETGYDVELIGIQAIYHDTLAAEGDINICFRAIPLGQPRHPLADDVLTTRWFTREELLVFPYDKLRHARARRRLTDWLSRKACSLELLVQS